MKTRLIKCWCLLIALALSLGLSRASAQICPISFLNNDVLTGFLDDYPNYPQSDAYFNLTVAAGQPIPAGIYLGWCVDALTQFDPSQGGSVAGTTYTGVLYPDCLSNLNSELPPAHTPTTYVSPAVWQEVNYLLNHKNGAYFWTIQVAINELVGGPAPGPSPPYPPYDVNGAAMLVSNAIANASSWTPQCNDVVGAVFNITNQNGTLLSTPVQLIIIEVPVCPITFTKVPANTNLGCNPGTIPGCVSGNTNLVNATSCCSRPVTITCTPADSTVGCQHTRIVTYTATDGFGNIATATQTITWTIDATAPVLTVPAGGTVTTFPTTNTVLSQTTVQGTCSTPTLSITSADTSNSCSVVRTFTITAKDACNLSTTKTVSYTNGMSKSSICGYVFQDCNGDGVLTPGIDAGIGSVLVYLETTNGVIIATNTTDSTGAYCFNNLAAGCYIVSITPPTSCQQSSGTCVYHYLNSYGFDCWTENDGYTHCKGSGIECWQANDSYIHYCDGNGNDCWYDKYGSYHQQPCTYTSCNVPKNNAETYCLSACESKTGVNFSYHGTAPKVTCTSSCPAKCTVGQTVTCNCVISNCGNTCLNSCQVSCNGKSYTCPSLPPGGSCTVPCTYTCKSSDYGTCKFSCGFSGSCPGISSPCTGSYSCSSSCGH